ncbi:MAG: hypothetical protein M3N16_01825 [Actinomycetota bacterium]|nr:hypothetical protein [Actinomycetota bacterium]
MRERLLQIVRVPDGSALSQEEVVDDIVAAVQTSINAAMATDREAAHQDALTIRHQLAGAEERLPSAVADELLTSGAIRAQIEEALAGTSQATPAINVQFVVIQNVQVVTAPETLPQDVEELLTQLESEDPTGVNRLREVFAVGGISRIATLIGTPEPWLEEGSPTLWTRAAQLVQLKGFFLESEVAFLRASHHPDADERSRVRQRVRAAGAALVRGDEARFRALLEEAKALDGDHPAVAIAEARASDDAEFMLTRTDGVVPETDTERALLEVTRAQAHLALRNLDRAGEHLAAARAADAENVSVREIEAVYDLFTNQLRVSEGHDPGQRAVQGAAERFTELRAELLEQRRYREAGLMAARATEALALAGQFEEARARVLGTSDIERQDGEALRALARVALLIDEPALARTLDPAATDDEARLLRAQALTQSDDAAERTEGVAQLDDLIESEDERVARQAALARLMLAATDINVPWNDKAEALLASETPANVAILKADRLRNREAFEAAEAVLLPHATDRRVRRTLRNLAALQQDWEKAESYSRPLVSVAHPAPRDRFLHATILRNRDQEEAAEREFLALARDERLPADLRAEAYEEAISFVLGKRRDLVGSRQLAEEWAEAVPTSERATWTRIHVLMRLAEPRLALQLLYQHAPTAMTVEQARLAAAVYRQAADRTEAVREIAALSDQFGRQNEQLEALVLVVSAEGEGELPEELAARVREALETFFERFPESTIFRPVSVPETRKQLDELMREQMAETIEARNEAWKEVVEGESGVAALASVGDRTLGDTWARLPILPLGFCDETLDQLERDDARAAIGHGAVWDPASLYVVGGLGADFEHVVRAALTGSVVAQQTLDDVAQSIDLLPKGDERQELGYNAETGEAYMHQWSAEEIARDRARAEGMLRLAKELSVLPATDAETDPEIVKTLDDPNNTTASQVTVGTLVLAYRLPMVIFSDDRHVRLFARRFGIRAFGTLALLDVLRERDLIDDETRRSARARLAARGAWGLGVEEEEMIEEAKSAAWGLNHAVRGFLNDRAMWRNQTLEMQRRIVALLDQVFQEAAGKLGEWVARGVDGSMRFNDDWEDRDLHAQALLAVAWNPFQSRTSDECFRAILAAIRGLPLWLRPLGDPVVPTLARTLSVMEGADELARFVFFRGFLRRLPAPDQVEVFSVFVQP